MTFGQVFAFDIETVPDVEFGRRLHGLDGLSDKQVGYVMQTRQRELTGSEFLSLEQQRVVAISVAMRTRDGFRAWSLGEPDSPEAELVQRFFDGIGRYSPVLVSWNGSAFDLPVLTYRALRHQLQAARYWELGEGDQSFRFNNYLGRFHWRHIDVMDVLAGYQNRARAALSDTAVLLGYPGKLGFDGSQVWDAYQRGELTRIRRYCETDVVNTWLVFLRFSTCAGGSPTSGWPRNWRARAPGSASSTCRISMNSSRPGDRRHEPFGARGPGGRRNRHGGRSDA
jgi:predicted PolB exonuclease-like 3'-5' exonuclease